MSRIVVVGGGITGLAAAWELRQHEGEVVVLEADDRFGGILRTSEFAGRPLDEAADSLLARVPWGVDLCRELGLGGELVSPAARNAYVWHDGALRPFPAGHVLGVPTDLDAAEQAGVLAPSERARAAHDLAGAGPRGTLAGDATIGSVVRTRLGDAVADRLVDPLVGGINAGGIDTLSIDAVTPQLAAAAHEDGSLIEGLLAQRAANPPDPTTPVFHAHPQGMGQIVRVLALKLLTAGVELRTSVRVAELEPAPAGGWLLHAEDEVIPADQVVLALPASRAAALLGAHVEAEHVGWLGSIDHASVAMVALALPEAALGRPLDGSGYLIPRTSGTTVTAVSWASSKWAHLAGLGDGIEGTSIVRASVGRAGDGGVALELDDDDLLARVLDDLAATMDLAGEPAEVRTTRWPSSLPQYAPGHLDHVAALEAAVRRQAPGLHLAGAAYRGLGVPACIRQGREAAAVARAALNEKMVP